MLRWRTTASMYLLPCARPQRTVTTTIVLLVVVRARVLPQYLPLMRDFYLWFGSIDASKRSLLHNIGKGRSVMLLPGA